MTQDASQLEALMDQVVWPFETHFHRLAGLGGELFNSPCRSQTRGQGQKSPSLP